MIWPKNIYFLMINFYFQNPLPSPPQGKKILNIHRRKKNLNKSYWEFDFNIGTVLVIFSFFMNG